MFKQVKKLWQKMFFIPGRLNRLQFALEAFIPLLLFLLLSAIGFAFSRSHLPVHMLSGALLYIFAFICFIFVIIAFIRRLHDLSLSGYWLILMVIPFVSDALYFVLLIKSGDSKKNIYGKVQPALGNVALICAVICWLALFLFRALVLMQAIHHVVSYIHCSV